MKILFLSLLLWVGAAEATPSQVYVRCFDDDYTYKTTLDGAIQVYNQVPGSSRYNAAAKLKINNSIYMPSGFVRYDGDPEFKTFRFFGSYLYQDGRSNGFKFLLGSPTFGADISMGVAPQFASRVIKLRCYFDSKPFPNYREIH